MAGGAVARFSEPSDLDVLSLDNATGFHEPVEFSLVCIAWIVELSQLTGFLSATSSFVSVLPHNLGQPFGARGCLLGDRFARLGLRKTLLRFLSGRWFWWWRLWAK
jgi:hypothetical protein